MHLRFIGTAATLLAPHRPCNAAIPRARPSVCLPDEGSHGASSWAGSRGNPRVCHPCESNMPHRACFLLDPGGQWQWITVSGGHGRIDIPGRESDRNTGVISRGRERVLDHVLVRPVERLLVTRIPQADGVVEAEALIFTRPVYSLRKQSRIPKAGSSVSRRRRVKAGCGAGSHTRPRRVGPVPRR